MYIHKEQNIEQQTHWYALKVFYNKVFNIEHWLNDRGIESYIPLKSVERTIAGRTTRRRVPAISSLMFMCCDAATAEQVQSEHTGKIMIYTNRGEKHPTAIPDDQMRRFMAVTSIDDMGMEYFGDTETTLQTGDRVRVTDGIFKGTEGYIKRIKGNRRLIVAIEGIVAVATSYIPQCFLEKISD